MENLNYCEEHDCFFQADTCPACKAESVLKPDVSLAMETVDLHGDLSQKGIIPGTVKMMLGGSVKIVDDGNNWLITEFRGERVGRIDYEDGDFGLTGQAEISYQHKRVEENDDTTPTG